MQRRRALKHFAMRVPMRPLLQIPARSRSSIAGILDGSVGWEYARMMRVFQEMIDLALAGSAPQPGRLKRDRPLHARRRGEIAESKQ